MKCENQQEGENQPANVTIPSQGALSPEMQCSSPAVLFLKIENRGICEINNGNGWIQKPYFCEERLKRLGQFISGKKKKQHRGVDNGFQNNA